MLNIGIIGITDVLEPHVKRIQKNKNVNVIGKASVGTNAQLNSFHFSIPEFNRIELVERADVLLVDNSSRLPFEMLCNIVMKGKHIFATEYLNLSIDECTRLDKLAYESGSIVQVSNSYFYLPCIQWLNTNFSKPFYLNVSKFAAKGKIEDAIYPLLLMLIRVCGLKPKKIGALSFTLSQNNTDYTNVRLEFGDASVVNLNFGSQFSVNKFKLEVYSRDKFVSLNIGEGIFLSNTENIDLLDYSSVAEFDAFIDSIQKRIQKNSNLDDYLSAVELVQSINKRITQFSE